MRFQPQNSLTHLIIDKNLERDEYGCLMKGEISGKAKNVLAYIGMPWNSQGMEFCKNCNITFNVILPDPIFFLKEEPIFEDVKVVNNYVR